MIASEQTPKSIINNLAIGFLIEVDGSHVVAELDTDISDLSRVYGGEVYAIGQFGSVIKLHYGPRIIYGFVTRLRMKSEYEAEKGFLSGGKKNARIIEADLFGEGEWILTRVDTKPHWNLNFERGIATYPLPQQRVYLTPSNELKAIYGQEIESGIEIGTHVGAGGASAYASLNELVGKHTAILGSTGTGKSGTVAAIIHSILDLKDKTQKKQWQPNIIILDPHNEYGRAFPGHVRLSTDEGSLRLPYWLFSLQEMISLLIGKTEYVATSQANIIKSSLLKARKDSCIEIGVEPNRINVDSPIPFKWKNFQEAIERDMPSQASKQDPYNSILNKLEIHQNDSRMKFLMEDWGGQDEIVSVIQQIIGSKNGIRVVDLSGIPNEVGGLASSVIARIIFSYKVWQTPEERASNPILLVCEEAHRYVPNSGDAQYDAAQEAIRRIAKEGRKYGIGLFLVSQRPSELDSTVLSQCNSWFVLRLSNEVDRTYVRGMLPDSLAGLVAILFI